VAATAGTVKTYVCGGPMNVVVVKGAGEQSTFADRAVIKERWRDIASNAIATAVKTADIVSVRSTGGDVKLLAAMKKGRGDYGVC